jgi:hypothetical protein
MTDSVKCLGLNEVLEKAKSFDEISADLTKLIPKNPLKLRHDSPKWKPYDAKLQNEKWVSVDVLKEFSLAKEHPLRKLWEKRPRFAFNKEEWIDSTGEPISDEVAEYWFADFDKVFDETLARDEVSVSLKQLEESKQVIQNLVEMTQAENDKMLEGFNEDKTNNSKDEATLRCSYWNTGFIEGLKQARSVFGEAFSQKGSLQEKKE